MRTADGRALEETLGIAGRVYKDIALVSRGPARGPWLRRAFDAYHDAFRRTGGYWTGTNAATIAVLSDRLAEGRTLAADVRALCTSRLEAGPPLEERYWLLATLAEAALIEGRLDEARARYAQAVTTAPDHVRSIVSTRRNARLLVHPLDVPWSPVAEALPVRAVVVFTGHIFRMHDPVSRRLVHVGTHINRAARIEPVTPPGQVWASQEFAALVALEHVRDFTCGYVGQVSLATDYGVFPSTGWRPRSGRSNGTPPRRRDVFTLLRGTFSATGAPALQLPSAPGGNHAETRSDRGRTDSRAHPVRLRFVPEPRMG
jgi:hypothetical protein